MAGFESERAGILPGNQHACAARRAVAAPDIVKKRGRLCMMEVTSHPLHAHAATGHTAAWTVYSLSQHPEAEARLVAELAQHGLLATAAQPTPRPIEWDDIPKLTYLQAGIKVGLPGTGARQRGCRACVASSRAQQHACALALAGSMALPYACKAACLSWRRPCENMLPAT